MPCILYMLGFFMPGIAWNESHTNTCCLDTMD